MWSQDAARTHRRMYGVRLVKRVQLSRAKGWRMPPNTVSVARPTLWGNPFLVCDGDAATCVALYENALRGRYHPASPQQYMAHHVWIDRWRARRYRHPNECIHELRGKDLACWCSLDAACHADVLLRLANAGEETPK